MASKHSSKHRLSAWYIPAALILFFIVLWLVVQQVPSNNLSASNPQTLFIDKWSCSVRCTCITWKNPLTEEQTVLGEATGAIDVCTEKSLNDHTLDPEDPFPYSLEELIGDEYGSSQKDNCDTACAQQYIGVQPIIGSAFSLTSPNLQTCQKVGRCPLNIPKASTTPASTTIKPVPSASPSPVTTTIKPISNISATSPPARPWWCSIMGGC